MMGQWAKLQLIERFDSWLKSVGIDGVPVCAAMPNYSAAFHLQDETIVSQPGERLPNHDSTSLVLRIVGGFCQRVDWQQIGCALCEWSAEQEASE
jgi:hypothetical protein